MSVQDQTAAASTTAPADAAETTHGVLLSDVAATKVKNLLDQEGRDDLALRISVQPGGCSGLKVRSRWSAASPMAASMFLCGSTTKW